MKYLLFLGLLLSTPVFGMDVVTTPGGVGTITGVTAGGGLSGGGSSGSVTLSADASSVTLQGNSFNGASQLVQTTSGSGLSISGAIGANNFNSTGSTPPQNGFTTSAANTLSLYTNTTLGLQITSSQNVSIPHTLTVSTVTVTSATITNLTATNATGFVGRVLQSSQCVVNASSSTAVGTYVPSNLTCAITPSSTTSKVKVYISCFVSVPTGSGSTYLTILRAGSNILDVGGFAVEQANFASAGNVRIPFATTYLDSPASSSSLTYTLGFKNDNSQTAILNDTTSTCIMLLEEMGTL